MTSATYALNCYQGTASLGVTMMKNVTCSAGVIMCQNVTVCKLNRYVKVKCLSII